MLAPMADDDQPPLIALDDRQDGAVDLESLIGLARATLLGEGIADAELSISLVTEAEIAELHERYLHEAGPTDVLSFPLDERLNHSFIILDEAQNTTPEQMKMFLTRLGFGSKAVVNGDVTQIDLPTGQTSGLVIVQEILRDIEGIEVSHLGARDVVRHKIVQDIVEAYRLFGEQRARADG